MKTLEELKAQHTRELETLEREQSIRSTLPAEPRQVCIHKDHASVVYGKPYPERYTFREAYELFKLFTPIVSEHWKSGCLSCRPASINDYAKDERAVMDGSSIAEIEIQAGKGYDSHALSFWTEINGQILDVSIEIRPDWKWLPQTDFKYDSQGNCIKNRVSPPCIGEDSMRKWWSPEGSYKISYYWADLPSFEAFSSTAN